MPQQLTPLMEAFVQELTAVQQRSDASMIHLLETHRQLTAGYLVPTATQQHPLRDAQSSLPEHADLILSVAVRVE